MTGFSGAHRSYPFSHNLSISPITHGYLWVSYPQESLENTINTMGTLLGQWLFLVPWTGGRWHIIPQLAVYTTYIPLIYCLLGGYMLPTTFYGNQKQPLIRGTANCPLTLRISGTSPGLPVQAGVGGNKCDEWDLEYLSLHLSHRCVKFW